MDTNEDREDEEKTPKTLRGKDGHGPEEGTARAFKRGHPSQTEICPDSSKPRPSDVSCNQFTDRENENKRKRSTEVCTDSGPGPGPSGTSCDDRSMFREDEFKQQPFQSHLSAASVSSDESIGRGINFKEHQINTDNDPQSQSELDFTFKCLEETVPLLVQNEVRRIHKAVSAGSSEESPRFKDEDEGRRRINDAVLNLIVVYLREKKKETMADRLLSMFSGPPDEVCRRKLKSNLQQKFKCVFEGITKAGKPTPLNQIYTELYITEGGASEGNNEHEVMQIETTLRNRAEDTITCQDIFKNPADTDGPIRTVLTKGVAGVGKTVLTQKFSLDWAEDRSNRDVQLLFPFTFRELNLLRDKNLSLVDLIHDFFPETKEAGVCHFEAFKMVLIFDGLDEFQTPLDFNNTKILSDANESATVDVLLVNLIRGKLLSKAHVWITTRPAAANQIPVKYVNTVTEVRGFADPQKDEYFRKRFRTKKQATDIISHIKMSRSLHIMCRIPVFCWITATVLEDVLKKQQDIQLPKTLTEMYIHFLVVQVKVKNVKYDGKAESDPHWSQKTKKMIESLAKLAFEQLQKGNLIFYESDLSEYGIDGEAASIYSGVFTQISKEERGLYQERVYSFIHLSVQEFLAALRVHLTFNENGVNLLSTEQTTSKNFYQNAVDRALQSPNGHLDLFLRFLLGLSLSSNQNLLRGFLKQDKGSSESRVQVVEYIKSKVTESSSTERSINLFHCLNELNDSSLVEQIQQYVSSGSFDAQRLSPAQWSALAFILLSSSKDLDVFDLRRYSVSDEVLLRLLPVVKASNKAMLSVHCLSEKSCSALSSVLSSQSTCLREVDLSNTDLKDSRLELLLSGLKTSLCPLEVLRFCNCNLSIRSCEALSSLLTSQSSNLTHLDLSNNDLMDPGVKLLSDGLKSPVCQLETLGLSGCMITEDGSFSLASALNSNPVHLKELDLRYNHLSDSGETLLWARVDDPGCRLDTLSLQPGGARWRKPGLKKYSCDLRPDPTTAHPKLQVSVDQRSVVHVEEDQSYPDLLDRFDVCPQVLCSQSLSGRCYWELEWSGWVDVTVCYKGIRRRGASDDCVFGMNAQSWCLSCSDGRYSVSHNKGGTVLPLSSGSSSGRIAVYVDWSAGSLSFYSVSGDELILLHKYDTTFTEPLFAGFGLWSSNSSVTLCEL